MNAPLPPVRIRRKNTFNILREGQRLASFDEFPMLRPEVDPQLHASMNSVDQPFHLECEKDTVVAQMSGRSRIEFKDGPTRFFDAVPGDLVYVPGRAVHRIRTVEPGLVLRYKAKDSGGEAAIWLCEGCGEQLARHEWDNAAETPQEQYQTGCERFNSDASKRRCPSCGRDHDPIDLSPFRWQAISEKIVEGD
ncbi:hypothetical protein [Sphingobium subterraneum]|uniref:3-hydroxyanthranilate 3,4-dioxygenase n=1 Tax=Sphingobium subterraneum TaxID=627688 RepID=A0A841J0N9_9SPHN|nr:hypothetical protein [Sphingobium subterraneum]MBB6123096.1 3-hydroxyanthranilate 3,4-dioxygenase [Sphingobium subterraneum]